MKLARVVQITDATTVTQDQLFGRIRAGVAVQLRDPMLCTRSLAALGAELRQRTRAVGAQLIINDRLDLARWLDADGVHLGRRSVSIADARAFVGSCIVTCSAHSTKEALARADEGADAVLFSPVFASPGKGFELGVESITALRRELHAAVSLIALGGVELRNAQQAFSAGADGVAAIRADLSTLAP